MNNLTTVKDGFYGTDEETYLVVDNKVFIVQSVNGLIKDSFSLADKSVLDKEDCSYIGEFLSNDLVEDYRTTITRVYQSLIDVELKRLNVSDEDDVCSGITTEVMDIGDNIDEEDAEMLLNESVYPLKVYEDHASGWVDAEDFYNTLKTLKSASLDSDSPENIWNYIIEI